MGPSGDFRAGRSAMLAHHLEGFCPAHAGETARKSDGASECRTIQFDRYHHRHVALLRATHLSTCLLFSRPASTRTRRWSLLFFRIDAGAERIHQIDHTRWRTFPSGFDLFAGLFLLQEIDEGVFVAILELRRIEVTRLRLHDVGS